VLRCHLQYHVEICIDCPQPGSSRATYRPPPLGRWSKCGGNDTPLNNDGMIKLGDVHYQTELNLSIFSERDLINDDSSFCLQIGCLHNQQSNRSRFVRRDRSSSMKKNTFVRFITVTHTITLVIISHNTSVPMIGHLELAIGMLTSRASWARLINICP